MVNPPPDLLRLLADHGQEHLLQWWPELTEQQRASLVHQLQSIDLAELRVLYSRRDLKDVLPPLDRIQPLPQNEELTAEQRARFEALGEAAFRAGRVAFLVVAGGQGSRLGFDQPKGMFPVGPVSGASLFQVHAEKVLALRRRYQASLPLLVMTSPATDEDTRRFFSENDCFGLPSADVLYFCQGTMPALDLVTGKLLMESKSSLFLSPNGHGGTLTGLADSGLLDLLESRGVDTISYFQVDNPMIDLGDRIFLGRHLDGHAEVSSKALVKQSPTEKLGNFVVLDGRCSIIEYSDLPEDLARRTGPDGRLLFWAGSPAIHLFDLAFLRRMTRGTENMPWHLARKKVPHVDDVGREVQPAKENALKFERFIFDVLPKGERWTVQATTRKEFEPLKNATGPDSPETVRRALSDQAADWLERCGVSVPRDSAGHAAIPLEISPAYALDAAELAVKIPASFKVPPGGIHLAK